jgi:predicted O-linked N-acetylglucosamine transferase (SPINDLY family)
VCTSRDDYVARILELAADAPRRRALRKQLLAARDTSPLFDSTRFARDIEALYVRMIERHDAGLPPAPLAAD